MCGVFQRLPFTPKAISMEDKSTTPFSLQTGYTPMGDQPEAITALTDNIRAGVPALVSKSMPTVQSLELAEEYGLKLFIRQKI